MKYKGDIIAAIFPRTYGHQLIFYFSRFYTRGAMLQMDDVGDFLDPDDNKRCKYAGHWIAIHELGYDNPEGVTGPHDLLDFAVIPISERSI